LLTLFASGEAGCLISRSEGAGMRNRFREQGSCADHPIFYETLVELTCMRLRIVAACIAMDQLEAMRASDTAA
jgi:hypothetical protein